MVDNKHNGKKKQDEKQNIEELKQEVIMDEHKISVDELFLRLKTNPDSGLTFSQAKVVLERDGPNSLTPPKKTPEWVKYESLSHKYKLRDIYNGHKL